MTDAAWADLIEGMHNFDDEARCLNAVDRLHHESTASDIPRLIALLEDESFFIREAAAWPLSDLGAVETLPNLLEALDRGFQEGHDNDGLLAALADLAANRQKETKDALERIIASGRSDLRRHAEWLLEFCA